MESKNIKKFPRLLSIELENFQSITKPMRIDFSPITLFYGPNSAGKSAVYDALELMELFWDPRKSNNEIISSYLNKWAHQPKALTDEERVTRISITIWNDFIELEGKYDPLQVLNRTNRFVKVEDPISSGTIKYELKAKFNSFTSIWQIEHASISYSDDYYIDGYVDEGFYPILEVSKILPNGLSLSDSSFDEFNKSHRVDPQEKTEVVTLIYHKTFTSGDLGISEEISVESLTALNPRFCNVENKFYFGRHAFSGVSIYSIDLWLFDDAGDSVAKGFKDLFLDCLNMYGDGLSKTLISAFQLVSADRRIPSPESTISINNGDNDSRYELDFITQSISDKFANKEFFFNELAKLAQVSKISNNLAIGRSLENKTNERTEITEFSRINRYLSDYLFIDKGYQIDAELNFLIPMEDGLNNPKSEYIARQPVAVRLFLKDTENRKIEIQDVGSGIAFVIPVLVSISKQLISTIQQPELHLHPALQSALGDILIDRLNDSKMDWQAIVETHSEHLLLRLLRRIRNTEQGKCTPENDISPNDLAVYYFNPLPEGSTEVKKMEITPSGDFYDLWPNGFFDERDKDLFS